MKNSSTKTVTAGIIIGTLAFMNLACRLEAPRRKQSFQTNHLIGAVTDETFRNPPNEYRIVQYKLSQGTLKDFPEYGIGGYMAFFNHELYRQGPDGPGRIGPLVEAARNSGRKVWLADDWGYPSGMAGGRVVAQHPEFELRSLVMIKQSGEGKTPISFVLPEELENIVAAVIYPLVQQTEGEMPDYKQASIINFTGRKINTTAEMAGKWQLSVFARFLRNKNTQCQQTKAQFKHTGRFPNLMNKKAVSSFIENMHEPIISRIKTPKGVIEGFYCNEPNLMQTCWKFDGPYACAPWTASLPATFNAMHGYELTPYLAACFAGNDITSRRVRIHYRQTVAALFSENFAAQIRDWCNKRGIKSSGHFLLNEYLSMHVQGYGDMMKFVAEFDIPALDISIPNPNQFMAFPYQQSRFFSSVTAWKKRFTTLVLLDPIIGGHGMERLSPELPLLLNSVNMAAFHGIGVFSAYMPLKPGQGAKGYTFAEYRFLNKYIGRLTQVLRGAQREAGVGLYYPIAMFQADLLPSRQRWPQIVDHQKMRQQAWNSTEKALLDGDIEYMIVHPEAVAKAEIKAGQMTIGYGSYNTLVMPQLDFIPLAVAAQLKRFAETGGNVLWVNQFPSAAEHAKNDPAVKALLRNAKAIDTTEIVDAIPRSFSSQFDLAFTPDSAQMLVGRFRQEGKQVYLLVNRLQKIISVGVNSQRAKGEAREFKVLDPSTGGIRSVTLPTTLSLGANRSLMLVPEQDY